MTVAPPRTGLRARLTQLARMSVAFAIVLGVAALGSVSPAFADETDTAGGDEASALYVSAGTDGALEPGAPLTVTLTSVSDQELSAGVAQVQLGTIPLVDSASVDAWLDAGTPDITFIPLGSEATLSLDASSTGTTAVQISATQLDSFAPGVYPLYAEIEGAIAAGDGEPLTATSVLVISATRPEVTAVVPITATPASGVMLSEAELATLTAPDGALTAQLVALSGTSAAMAIDPAILASIRALGGDAPESATNWLIRLDALTNERFALQFGDADATAQAQAELPALLEPLSFTPFLDPKNFSATPTPTPTPTAGAAAVEPVLPTNADLLDLPDAASHILWPRANVDAATLAAFAAWQGGGSTAILPSAAFDNYTSARATLGGTDLLVADSDASTALSRAAAEPNPLPRAKDLAAATAHLYLSGEKAPGARLLIGLDRNELRTADALRDAVEPANTELSALRSEPASPVALATDEITNSLAASLDTLLADESKLVAFSSILEDPLVLLAPERIRILRAIAVSTPAEQFAQTFLAQRAATNATLAAVSIKKPSAIQLLAANADLPIWVENRLPWPVNVRLAASPTDPKLDVQPVTVAVALADSNTRVKVPVSARVGSGEVGVRLSLSSPTGVSIGSTQVAQVSVRAEWETIGVIIFGSLAALLIVFGTVRTVRRKRHEATGAGPALAGLGSG